jgi:NAD(P)-dependent dehydrogenase (short-subunit alcohol dehydrogenase family)/acyl dehydratase/putative sterol carrier protein
MGLLEGKVVVITGAGGGIGREHALACARAGARVVVNDLGGSRDGSGSGSSMAEAVCAEIAALGGEAIPDFHSVSDYPGCEAMIGAALQRWGRVDGVVNNAGILRDKTFAKLTPEEWDLVVEVHLTGTRNVIRASLDALRAQGGAIVNTTSYSGLIGNFGQANYAAAKAGVYGLSRVLALELRKAGITVNCVAPVAKTRMTEEISMVADDWRAEQISPIVVLLLSPLAAGVTGQVFGVQGQRLHLYEMKTNAGVEKAGSDLWTPEEIHARFAEISAWEATAPPLAPAGDDVVTAVFSHFPAGFKPASAPGWKANIQWVVSGGTDQTVVVADGVATVHVGRSGSPTCTVKTDKDTLVAMFKGELDPAKAFMGGKASADNMGDLMKLATAFDFGRIAASFAKGTPAAAAVASAPTPAAPTGPPIGKRYDGGFWLVDRAEFQAYAAATDDDSPAYVGDDAVAPPMYHVRPFMGLMMKLATDPDLALDMLRLVHGEHDMAFHRPLRHGDVLQLRGTLRSLEEKSSGKVVTYGLVGFVDGQVALEGTTSYFIRGKAKDGEKKEAKVEEPPPPPTWAVREPVTPDQATRYAEASGDHNPIHVDPATARAAGLPGVILHGLCTMAFAQRDLVRHYGGDPRRLKRLAVRFARPVFPGDTLSLAVWERDGRVEFATTDGSGKVVIANGRAEIGA